MYKYKILVADDDNNICELLRLYLEKENYDVVICNDGVDCLLKFQEEKPDLIIVDIMMPFMDGIQVCKKIRQSSNRPVIMLTARDEVSDKIQGLEIGADDYITKPFDSNELLARIKAVLRRYHSEQNATSNQEIRYNNLYINTSTMQVEIKNKPTTMTRKEFEILLFLVKNPNKVFNRDQMLNEIWGLECYVDTRTVDVHINRLRAKLENASTEWELRTIWGVGYKFEVHKNDA